MAKLFYLMAELLNTFIFNFFFFKYFAKIRIGVFVYLWQILAEKRKIQSTKSPFFEFWNLFFYIFLFVTCFLKPPPPSFVIIAIFSSLHIFALSKLFSTTNQQICTSA